MNADTTLLTWLATLDEQGLADLLTVRPDVLRPVPPRRLTELADRLASPESVYAALSRSSLPCLLLSEAIVVAARSSRPLASLVTEGYDYSELLDQLQRRALVLRDGDMIHICPALHDVLPTPLGLGPGLDGVLPQVTVAELTEILKRLGGTAAGRKTVLVEAATAILSDPERLSRIIARAPEGTRELLDDFAWRGAIQALDELPHLRYYATQGRTTPARWARDHGLIWSVDWEGTYVMPMEVALALRGPGWRVNVAVEQPKVTMDPISVDLVAHEASVAVLRVLDRTAALLEAIAAEPLSELKGGGVGVKEIRRLAKQLVCGEDEIRLLLDLTYTAGLLAPNPVTEVRTRRTTELRRNGISPTEGYDGWLSLDPADRFAVLAETWWALTLSPTGRYDGKARTPLTEPSPDTSSSVVREVVFGLLSADAAVRSPQEVAAAASWQLPATQAAYVAEVVEAVLVEARLLGLIGADALSSLGLALRTGSVAEAAAGVLAGARQQALFGADLTAVVTGPPSADLSELLDRAADRESGGSAATWRFSPSSVRRALDAGHRAEDVLAALTEVASAGLPQALTYLINDVARRHGELGVTPVGCCVVGDDQGLLAELTVHRKLAKLGLRRLAPTVLASGLGPAQTLALLREAGYAPVALEADGSLAVTGPAAQRAPQPYPLPKVATVRPADAAAWLVGTAGLRAPEPAYQLLREVFARNATGLSAEERARAAIEVQYGGSTRIIYDGAEITIASLEAYGSELDAWCPEIAEFRRFELAKITAVVP